MNNALFLFLILLLGLVLCSFLGGNYYREGLTNEVDLSYIFDYGQFWGMTIGEVKEKAPQYIEYLIKRKVIK